MLGKNKDFPIDLDLKKALKLPSVCGLQTPDVSLCSVAGYPVGAPSAGGPSSAPLAGMSPDAGGMSPEAAGGDSAGKNGASSSAHFNVAYLAAGFAMAFTSRPWVLVLSMPSSRPKGVAVTHTRHKVK
uniref:Uncharacterized protein n=1 Tax=Chenopodium quinoa TaxID=63459 RepID=A0A803KRF0_CHEQI